MEAMTVRRQGTNGAVDSGGCLIWIGAPGGLSSSSRSLRLQRSAPSLGKHRFTQARNHLLCIFSPGAPSMASGVHLLARMEEAPTGTTPVHAGTTARNEWTRIFVFYLL
jgi:hypothetical protein